ncbi:MAG: dual specificity protein phosphatase family protein [Phycisphaerae bacterium]|nr:dual specificity protein phosphatase family protein [Phycisphaerae bacterium]
MRCGQPRVRDLEQIRQTHGLGAVVCARGGTRHPLRGRWFRKERAFCERHDIHLEHIRMSDKAASSADVFERFLNVVRDSTRRPVLVHCEQGFHRTGVLCAAYRIALDGWQLRDATAEMDTHGFETSNAKRAPLLKQLDDWARAHHPAAIDGPR